MNPCEAKGRYGGPLHAGRFYIRGSAKIVIPCCECSVPLLSMTSGSAVQRNCIAMSFGPDGISTGNAAGDKSTAEIDLIVVPCSEKFRHPTSMGTRLYREHSKSPTKFAGCQPLESELLRDGLVRHELAGALGNRRDALLDELRANRSRSRMDETFPDLLRELPVDIGSGQKQPIFWLDLLDAKSAAREEKRSKKRRVRAYLETLTPAQRDAIERVYLKNETGISRRKIAELIGISVESLRDRISQAVKKLEVQFPEYRSRSVASAPPR